MVLTLGHFAKVEDKIYPTPGHEGLNLSLDESEW